MTYTNAQAPQSSKKIFVIATLISLIAIAGIVFFLTKTNPNKGVDSVVLEDTPDPALVFDAPFTKAQLFYIDLEKFKSNTTDPAAIGCGDGFVAYEIPVGELYGSTKIDALTYVVAQLFDTAQFKTLQEQNASKKVQAYNALEQSSLTIKSIKELPDRYEVKLTGTYKVSGVCDGPRIQSQLQQTIEQIVTPVPVSIFINDIPLKDVFSQQ